MRGSRIRIKYIENMNMGCLTDHILQETQEYTNIKNRSNRKTGGKDVN